MRTSKVVLRSCKLTHIASRSVFTRSAVPSLIRSMHQDTPRVLSIQSHVVHGHVGNKCAVFPLQLLGFDVDPINSVQFSNHTVAKFIKALRQKNPDLIYSNAPATVYVPPASHVNSMSELMKLYSHPAVCDPVMGDDNRLYVSKDLVPAYRDQIVSLATVLTPNQYEAELLTGIKINSKASALAACQALHHNGVATVVITSIKLAELKDELLLMASTQTKQKSGCPMEIQVNIPMLDAYFTGTGDLLAALLLARLYKDPDNMQHAIELAVASLQGVLLASADASGEAAHATERTAQVCRKRELRLIQNQHLLQSPPVKLKAKPLDARLESVRLAQD